MTCNGSSGSSVFKWLIQLDNGNEEKLFLEQEINVKVNVTLISKEGTSLWPSQQGGIRVIRGREGGSINVHHTRLKNADRRGSEGGRTVLGTHPYDKDVYICGWGELTRGDEKTVYEDGVNQGQSGAVSGKTELKIHVRLDLLKCHYDREGKQATCDLKVTDGEVT